MRVRLPWSMWQNRPGAQPPVLGFIWVELAKGAVLSLTVVLLLMMAIFVGATMQRLTGMGFALVAAPFVVLLMGAVTGIVLVNLCGTVASAFVLFRVIRHVDWKKFCILATAAIVGVVPGAFIVKYVPSAWLEVGVGLLVLISLSVSLRITSFVQEKGVKPMLLAGAASGIMNTTAGVGGPAMSVYAVASRWDQRSFAATMQPYFLIVGVASIWAKYVADPSSMPFLEPWAWGAMGVAVIAGLFAGEVLTRWITPQRARLLVVILAYAGAAAATIRGVLELLA